MPLDLSRGVEWHAVIILYAQPLPGTDPIFRKGPPTRVEFHAEPTPGDRKVIFEAGPLDGGPKLTLGLDAQNKLFIAATDVDGMEYSTPSVEVPELDRPLYVACIVEPAKEGIRLRLMVDGVFRADVPVRANFGGSTMVKSSMGTDVRGEQPAAFAMLEFLGYVEPQTDQVRSQIGDYLRAKHGLKS